MIDAALAAITVALFSSHRVVGVADRGSRQIEKDCRGPAAANQKSAAALAPVTLLEIFFRQSVAVDAMIDDRLGHVADGDVRSRQAAGKVDVFRGSRRAWPKTLVEAADLLEYLTAGEKVRAV